MFEVGDNARATKEIRRQDNRSVVKPEERVKITRVYHGTHYTIVDIEPDSGELPMVDVCCDQTGPLLRIV